MEFKKLSKGSEILDMSFQQLGEMFEGDSTLTDTCAGKFPLMLMEGRAEGLAFADLGASTPLGVYGNFHLFLLQKPHIPPFLVRQLSSIY